MMSRSIGRMYQRGSIWWIDVSAEGRRVRQSTGSTRRGDAQKLLRQRIAEIQDGRFQPDGDKLTFGELEVMIRDHYAQMRSGQRVEVALKHLRRHLGLSPVKAISYARLTAYRNDRLAERAAAASIKYELATLHKGLKIAVLSGKLAKCPEFPTVKVDNTRQGFFELSEFEAVRDALPLELRGLVTVGYLTGWRIRSELQTMQWSQVDFEASTMRLEPGTTKNGRGRTFPFSALPELKAVLKRQRQYRDDVAKRTEEIAPWVFHREGKPIKGLRRAWASACIEAGLEGKLMHDFRRTAVRNLERAVVPRSVAMQLTGHLTESVYQRYAIVTESDLTEGVAKLATLTNGANRKVLPLRGTVTAQSGAANG